MDEKSERLLAMIKEALGDKSVSRKEQQHLGNEFKLAKLSTANTAWLRTKVVEFIKAQTDSNDARQLIEAEGTISRLLPGQIAPDSTDVFFGPGDACHNAIIKHLESAQRSIDVCVFTITDDRIKRAMLRMHYSQRNIRIITDNDKAGDGGSDIGDLADASIPIRIDGKGHMHHKFCIIDGKTLITGSLNWTNGGRENFENILITTDPSVISAYSRQFNFLWESKMHPHAKSMAGKRQ